MSAEENKAIIRDLFAELNKGNLGIVDRYVAPEYVEHVVSGPEIYGPEGLKEYIGSFAAAFPDMQITVEDLIAEQDKVVTRFTIHGTHKGALLGIPPTGKPVSIAITLVSRLVNGKVVEDWESIDQLGMLQQIGVIPRMGQGPR